jgi:hypothetical protein
VLTTEGLAASLTIKEAKWERGDRRLVVKGEGPREARIEVANAGDGSVLGSTRGKDEGDGEWRFRKGLEVPPCRVSAEANGQIVERAVKEAGSNCDAGAVPPPTEPPPILSGNYSILAANDLGMHCADLDYQIFSILPFFNVVHAQVILKGSGSEEPQILTDDDVDVVYSAVADRSGSINTGAIESNGNDKTNFWATLGSGQVAGHENALGGLAYAPLYPSVLAGALLNPPVDLGGLCDTAVFPVGCPSILNLFEPIATDTGLPVPDLHKLYPSDPLITPPELAVGQQKMPGIENVPQYFDRFDADLPFFVDLPFGYRVHDANWFAADGIPISPIDDEGDENAYPIMRVEAVAKGADPGQPENVLASVDVVLPVASEADCQGCHAASDDEFLTELGYVSNGEAADMASVDFDWVLAQEAPGSTRLNQLQNAAKINILRLHDAKHWDNYEAWDANGDLVAAQCDLNDPSDPNCLANQTPVQCSQCHYSPALDLAQVGPVDEPDQGPRGRQQRHHISQSRAMHGHHGEFTDLFPEMPAPNHPDRMAQQDMLPINDFELGVLEATCYQCHPGKNTKCLRGAMFSGGMVCQDCHGNMEQVGNDFTADLANTPFPDGADLSKRVPWADEPGCQSCHTGDAVNNKTAAHPDLVAPDGIRLLQAYVNGTKDDGSSVAEIITAPGSRFAENLSLYRLSQGHGGVKCEGCHGSTHAVWPVSPSDNNQFMANDNLAALGLQGHTGTITECTVCHEGGLGLTLDGPHGMHPVADLNWNKGHEYLAEGNGTACKSCHGADGQGTVLSRTAALRTWECKDEKGTLCNSEDQIITVAKGTQVSCTQCHENEINDGHDD